MATHDSAALPNDEVRQAAAVEAARPVVHAVADRIKDETRPGRAPAQGRDESSSSSRRSRTTGPAEAGRGSEPEPDRRPPDPARVAERLQQQVAALLQEQLSDAADTTRRLLGCSSLSAALAIQIEAAARTTGRLASHGQAMAGLGRDMVQALATRRHGRD